MDDFDEFPRKSLLMLIDELRRMADDLSQESRGSANSARKMVTAKNIESLSRMLAGHFFEDLQRNPQPTTTIGFCSQNRE